jgi:endonuclease/exonuclease/phosphatase family metal-dependent hydrolase
MRLLQLNAWSIRLATRVEDMIINESPDIVTLQEVFDSNSDMGLFPGLSQVAIDLKLHHLYFSPVYNLQFMGRKAEYGIATISNLELTDKYTAFTNLEYKDNFMFDDDDYNVRNFQHVVVRDQNDNEVHVINHHGYHVPGHKNGNDFTMKACQQIVDYARKLDGPVIIAGDFNLLPDSESIEILNKDFRNLTKEYDLQTTRTDLTHKTEPCDFIFVNNEVEVNDFYASEVVASDHQGLVLDFEVKVQDR